MYHRVLLDREIPADIDPGMYVTRESLERHLGFLARAFELVPLDAIGDWMRGKRSFEKTPCALTFDDGWEDNYRNAFGVLTAHRVPATIFLITDRVGTPGMMSWAQIDEMERAGISFGSHTATHPILPALLTDRLRWELETSGRTLRERLRNPSSWFCYPKGRHSEEVRRMVPEYYAGAVTVSGDWVSRGDDPYLVNRIGMHEDVSYTTPLLACRVARIF